MFSEGRERVHWEQIDLRTLKVYIKNLHYIFMLCFRIAFVFWGVIFGYDSVLLSKTAPGECNFSMRRAYGI